VAIIGSKNSGKTAVSEYLIERFVKDGFRVAGIKHIHHEFTIDTEGKDTWRMARKGAEIIASISPNEIAVLFKKINNWHDNFDKTLKLLKNEGIEVIVAEGFHMILGKRSDVLKIITVKKEDEVKQFLETTENPVIAIINNTGGMINEEKARNIPILSFPPDDELYQLVMKAVKMDRET